MTTPAERFWEKVAPSVDACWEWLGWIRPNGYGTFWAGKTLSAHRFAYELFYGAIPEGMVIDHLCRNRSCVRPDHLEAVSQRENVIERGTAPHVVAARNGTCMRGHVRTAENTWTNPKTGDRACLDCRAVLREQKRAQLAKAAG